MPVITKKGCGSCEQEARALYDRERAFLESNKIPLPQNDRELKALCVSMIYNKPSVFVEIGTRYGGSLYMLSHFCKPGSTIISIDMEGAEWGRENSNANRKIIANKISSLGHNVILIDGDSHSAETKEKLVGHLQGNPIDFLFIDGDHRFGGVLKDWEMYGPLVRDGGGAVAFHDIVENKKKAPRILVHFLWRSLKTVFKHKEYVYDPGGVFGIGVLFK